MLPLLLLLVFCCATSLGSLTVLTPQGTPALTTTSYDIFYLYRTQHDYSITGQLTNSPSLSPNCSVNVSRPSSPSDIVLVNFRESGCATLVDLVSALVKSGVQFAGLIVTYEAEVLTVLSITWGDPSKLRETSFEIANAPKSTYLQIMNYTNNMTTFPNVTLVSDMDPDTSLNKGFAARVYLSIYSVGLALGFIYASWVHIDSYLATGKCVLNIKTGVYLCIQLTALLQLLAWWLPVGFFVFFWYSYWFGFIGYCLVLLTWVRIVSADRTASATVTQIVSKLMHIMTYIAIAFFFLICTVSVISDSAPHLTVARSMRGPLYYCLPVVLLCHSSAFLYYGFRLINVLKSFNMTKEKKLLMRKMSFLMTVDVILFLIISLMSIITAVFNSIWIGRFVSNVVWAFSVLGLMLAIFMTLQTSSGARPLRIGGSWLSSWKNRKSKKNYGTSPSESSIPSKGDDSTLQPSLDQVSRPISTTSNIQIVESSSIERPRYSSGHNKSGMVHPLHTVTVDSIE